MNLSSSRIRTILKNKEKIVSSATTVTLVEKQLSTWIDDEIQRNMPLSQVIIIEKARILFNHIEIETYLMNLTDKILINMMK